jgi:DNA helicase IV
MLPRERERMTVTHPAFAKEQAHVERAYALLDRGLADAEQSFQDFTTPHRATAEAMRRALEILRNSRGRGQLVFGRLVSGGDSLHIGRRRVYDADRNLVVVSWHAPVAQAFYTATPQDPGEVELKRVFVEEDRVLKSIVDEIVRDGARAAVDGDGIPAISDALLNELERSRDGAMREVVATIQAEQFAVIRAGREGVLVVQGGPGTGKSVVGLHRAAWLAFNHPELRRQGLLVVAPTTAFLSYISGVLPSLEVTDVHQADLSSLYAGEARVAGRDDAVAARVKGSAVMAEVLARALAARIGWGDDDLELSLGADRVRVPAADLRAVLDDIRSRSLPHSTGREVLRPALSALAFHHYTEHQRDTGRAVIANEATIRRLAAFTNALDRMWPTFTPEEFLRSLYSTRARLAEAAEGLLTIDERAALHRMAARTGDDELWTADDLFCLDELSHLMNRDTMTYGHVVVDEAQDLSPMQARALGRRCPDGSFTLLGDLAQGTGPWLRDSWAELTQHIATAPARITGLSVGYRVPAQVLDLAALLLPRIANGLAAPDSIRPGRVPPTISWAPPSDLVDQAVAYAGDGLAASMTTALLVPDARYDDVARRCTEAGLPVGHGRTGDFSLPLTLVPVSLSKGLEFDRVVVVAPDEIVGGGPDGRRLLYVAMTRCTQELVLVHSAELPVELTHLGHRPLTEPDPTGRSTPAGHGGPTLSEAIGMLDAADRALVEAMVNRLLRNSEPSAAPSTSTEGAR